MIKKIKLCIAGLAVTLLGFESILAAGPEQELSSGPYVTRVIEPKDYRQRQVNLSVGNFSPGLHKKISGITEQIYFECSPSRGLVSTGGYSGFSDYIRSAFIEQLQDAGSYVAEAPVQLSGELQKVDLYFDSLVGESFSHGAWALQLTLRSSLGGEETFNVNHSYPIRNRNNYCYEMANQFMASVQVLMVEILGSEKFNELIRPTGITFR